MWNSFFDSSKSLLKLNSELKEKIEKEDFFKQNKLEINFKHSNISISGEELKVSFYLDINFKNKFICLNIRNETPDSNMYDDFLYGFSDSNLFDKFDDLNDDYHTTTNSDYISRKEELLYELNKLDPPFLKLHKLKKEVIDFLYVNTVSFLKKENIDYLLFVNSKKLPVTFDKENFFLNENDELITHTGEKSKKMIILLNEINQFKESSGLKKVYLEVDSSQKETLLLMKDFFPFLRSNRCYYQVCFLNSEFALDFSITPFEYDKYYMSSFNLEKYSLKKIFSMEDFISIHLFLIRKNEETKELLKSILDSTPKNISENYILEGNSIILKKNVEIMSSLPESNNKISLLNFIFPLGDTFEIINNSNHISLQIDSKESAKENIISLLIFSFESSSFLDAFYKEIEKKFSGLDFSIDRFSNYGRVVIDFNVIGEEIEILFDYKYKNNEFSFGNGSIKSPFNTIEIENPSLKELEEISFKFIEDLEKYINNLKLKRLFEIKEN